MKKLLMLLTLFSLLLITSCELFMDEPARNGTIYTVHIALDYQDSSYNHLYGTIPDAKELQRAFSKVAQRDGREHQSFLMIQEGETPDTLDELYPSKSNVINRLTALANITTEDDLTILTYSGHGEENSGKLVLGQASLVANTLMSPTELLSLVTAIKGKKLVILDSCFSGMFVEKSPSSTNTVISNSIQKFFETYHSSDPYEKPDLYVLSASAHADSYENPLIEETNHDHGFFSQALLKALGWDHPHDDDLSQISPTYPPVAKDGQITVDGLFEYIKSNQIIPSRFSLTKYQGKHQHPMTTGGPLDLVLFNL